MTAATAWAAACALAGGAALLIAHVRDARRGVSDSTPDPSSTRSRRHPAGGIR